MFNAFFNIMTCNSKLLENYPRFLQIGAKAQHSANIDQPLQYLSRSIRPFNGPKRESHTYLPQICKQSRLFRSQGRPKLWHSRPRDYNKHLAKISGRTCSQQVLVVISYRHRYLNPEMRTTAVSITIVFRLFCFGLACSCSFHTNCEMVSYKVE